MCILEKYGLAHKKLHFPISYIQSPLPISFFPLILYSTVLLAPLVGGITGSTIFPLLLATILAYCTTGYVRDELFHPLVKTCVGTCCSSLVSYSNDNGLILSQAYNYQSVDVNYKVSYISCIHSSFELPYIIIFPETRSYTLCMPLQNL